MPNTLLRKLLPLKESRHEDQPGVETAEDEATHIKSSCSFTILSKIGQGGYGRVYVVQKNQGEDENAIYAMKVN